LTQLRWLRLSCRQCWTPSQNTASRIRLKMTELLGRVHTHGMGLLRGWCGQ
jgi:hypothetical protein